MLPVRTPPTDVRSLGFARDDSWFVAYEMILLDFDHYEAIGGNFQGKLALLDRALFGGG
jgi:hypothetical protein